MEPITKEECNSKHTILMEKIDTILKEISDLKVSMASLPEKIFEKGDERYAGKTTERAVYAVIGALCLGILGAVFYLVIK